MKSYLNLCASISRKKDKINKSVSNEEFIIDCGQAKFYILNNNTFKRNTYYSIIINVKNIIQFELLECVNRKSYQ